MTAIFALPDRLEGGSLAGVRDEILKLRGEDLDLIGSDVERLNGLGFQLLLSAFQTWRGDGRRLRVVAPSPALTAAFFRLNLAERLTGEAA